MIGRVLFLVAVLLSAGCERHATDAEGPAAKVDGEVIVYPQGSPQLASLVVEPVVERPSAASVINGRLVWNEDKTVRVYTPFAGRVSRILVQPGDVVQQGQALAVIASPDFGQAQADARRAEGDYALAGQNLARVSDLAENGVVPAKDLHAAKAEHLRAESELKRTQARLKLYGGTSEIDQTYALKSPISGVVVEKSINPGQELRPDQMGPGAPALFVITNPSSLWVLLEAAEKDLQHLHTGTDVQIRVPAYGDTAFTARLTAVADFLDPSTRTIRVRGTIDNKDRRLKGEMFVTAVVSDGAKVLTVPTRAVFFQGGRHYTFVADGEGTFVRTEVKTGDAYEGRIAVLSGLQPGQKVVAEGALLLQQTLQPRRVMK
jgi:membrane fusion protein, heavy metal efflux system